MSPSEIESLTMRELLRMHSGLSLLLSTVVGCASIPTGPLPTPPPSSAAAGNTTIVAIAPPAGPKQTIWDFLGVTCLCQHIGADLGCLVNQLGSRFPGMEPGPSLKAITDPANAKSSNPAVAAAAAAKADEDAAPQKIKAIRYLGLLGCGGCYPDIEAALLAALDDCTESVRFETVSVLADSSRNRCRYCDSGRCCSLKVRKKLEKIATELNDAGCHVEPAARVRRMARVALCNCGGYADDPVTPAPLEGPSSGDIPSAEVSPAASAKLGESRQPKRRVKNADFERGDSIYEPQTEDVSSVVELVATDESDQIRPRVRWERAGVSIHDFDSRAQARFVMNVVRRKALGETHPTDSRLRFVTTRQFGWTRPEEVRSPELARVLFELPVGQISPVIEVGDQVFICRVLEKFPAPSVPVEDLPRKSK